MNYTLLQRPLTFPEEMSLELIEYRMAFHPKTKKPKNITKGFDIFKSRIFKITIPYYKSPRSKYLHMTLSFVCL